MTARTVRSILIRSFAVALFGLGTVPFLQAELITNAPMPIQYQVTVNPVIVSNTDGSNTAEFFGSAAQEAEIIGFINTIWAQAGIEVVWQTPEFWNDTFVNVGSNPPNTRPTSDLNTIVNMADTGGISDPDPNIINLFFVEIAAGFAETSENTANGLAFVGGNGITQHVGDNLPGFPGGREVVASVVAHEIGHNLGLSHIVEAENLMQSGGSPMQGERLNAAQILTARSSSFAAPVPEPGSLSILIVISVGLVSRRRR